MAFLLVTITFMILKYNIKIVTSKKWIIDIKNEHCY